MADNISSSLPPVDYRLFQPVASVLKAKNLNDENKTADALIYGRRLPELAKLLEAAGIRRISTRIRNGENAIVLEANDNMMIRIALDSERPRDKDDDILQPIATLEGMKGFRVEVLPKIHTLAEVIASPELCAQYKLTDPNAQAQQFIQRLVSDNLHKGKLFYSNPPENVALLKDRSGNPVPVILDPGSLADAEHPAKAPGDAYGRKYYDTMAMISMTNLDVFDDFGAGMATEMNLGKLIRKQLDEWSKRHHARPLACAEAQAAHLERLGLVRGEIRDAATPRLRAEERHQFIGERQHYLHSEDSKTGQVFQPHDAIYEQLRDKGVSQSEFGDMAKAALADDTTQGEGFCHRIREQAKTRGILPGQGK